MDRGLWKPAKRRLGDRLGSGVTSMTNLPLRAPCEHGRYQLHRFGVIGTPNRTVGVGGREVIIDDEADTEDVYQKEAWLPDVPGEGRYIWMIRSDVSTIVAPDDAEAYSILGFTDPTYYD